MEWVQTGEVDYDRSITDAFCELLIAGLPTGCTDIVLEDRRGVLDHALALIATWTMPDGERIGFYHPIPAPLVYDPPMAVHVMRDTMPDQLAAVLADT